MKNKIFPYIVLIAALSLAGSAAYYSVFGLGKLFSSQKLAVMIMAGTLEASKLIAATYLHRYWKKLNVFNFSSMSFNVYYIIRYIWVFSVIIPNNFR